MATKDYELLADTYQEVTSKPGQPLTYKTHVKGAKIKLEDERAAELIAAGAVADPKAKRAEKAGGKPKAPTGKAEGVGDGDADEGTQGDGGPDPAGTGSTDAGGTGGGAGDGQGSADGSASASNPNPPSTGRSRGSRSSS